MIHVVTGHICAGKSTFVRQHAKAADVVIDFDRMALSIAAEGTDDHCYSEPIREIVRVVRWFAIDEAVRLHARRAIENVWIIHAYPTDHDIARYRRLGSAIREMQADPETLRRRARQERPASVMAELERRLANQPIVSRPS